MELKLWRDPARCFACDREHAPWWRTVAPPSHWHRREPLNRVYARQAALYANLDLYSTWPRSAER